MDPTVLAERYQLGELIATGGMGSVYRGVDTHLGRPVAVKVLKRVLADDATFLERFRREARAAAGISHPGVTRVYDYGERSSEPFIVMELVDGDTLAQRITGLGRLPWEQAFTIAEQVAAALSAAHGLGVVHRDVKPANILIDRSGRVKVTDFGIARAARATTLTRPGMVLGSASYVAPEQAQGSQVGPAADLYSLGCVLFESVAGATPYQGRSAVAIATQHVSSPVPDPREHVPDLPEAAAWLIMRSLGKQPEDRFPSAAAMAAALADAREGGGRREAGDPSDASRAATTGLPVVRLAPSVPAPSVPAPGPSVPAPSVPAPSVPAPSVPVPAPGAAAARVTTGFPRAHTPPMPWARVPGDVLPAAAGPSWRAGRWARAVHPGERRGRRRLKWLIGLAFGLVALLALPLALSTRNGDAGSASPSTTAPASRAGGGDSLATARVAVPDLRGERVDDATAKLRALGLEVDVQRGRGGEARHGVVVAMSPRPGSVVDDGSRVRLLVGKRSGKGGNDTNEGD